MIRWSKAMTRFNVASAFMLIGVLGEFVSRRHWWLAVSLPAILVMLAATLNIRFEALPQSASPDSTGHAV
jgi:uncharacterized membrane protein YoaK (UPF0700 family)